MIKPKVTFLMMAYNTDKYIGKAIESFSQQTETEICLIIRNNGSTDQTGKVIRQYALQDPRIHVVENKKNGITDEGMKAFEEGWWPFTPVTLGEYVAILDSDDWLAPDFVEIMYNSAQSINADMVVSGSYFVDESTGQIVGERSPPFIQTREMNTIGPYFTQIYNSLRTWWGKLYKTEFFLQHYTECWTPIKPTPWPLDTGVVLNYLRRCSGFVCLSKPLYYFLNRSSSTFSRRSLDIARTWEADSLFTAGVQVLEQLRIRDDLNYRFLLAIHWGFMEEAMRGLFLNEDLNRTSPRIKMNRLAMVWNDRVVGSYLHKSFQQIWSNCELYIDTIIVEDAGRNLVWNSYMARLKYWKDNMQGNPNNVLWAPLLFSCLCDSENKHYAGLVYLSELEAPLNNERATPGLTWFRQRQQELQLYFYDNPQELLGGINKHDRTSAVIEKEEQLSRCIQEDDFEAACDLIEEISSICPFNLVAMFYRIHMAILLEEWETAALLAASAKVLWPDERDIQILYWDLQNLLENR